MRFGDTIAAVSTPRGKGGVALLRVSGCNALEIVRKVFIPKKNNIKLGDFPRSQIYGTILASKGSDEWEPIDDGLATFFPGPHSFTGEDTIEICCHGGILLTQTILESLFVAGARPAEAGEFTRRAFVNGKMGLASAESLGNMLEAQTKNQLRLAHSGLSGKLERICKTIYDKLTEVLATIYAKIDYPDEDLADLSREEMIERLQNCLDMTSKLCDSYKTGHAVAEGLKTVICGKPNVGKSTLFNSLVGSDVAIVTEIQGTTRDVLTETVPLGRITLRLSDTAGLHTSDDVVEKIGIERAEKAIDTAELIMAVFDAKDEPDEEDIKLIQSLKEKNNVIYILNKSDCGICESYKQYLNEYCCVSAKNGEGIEQLISLVEKKYLSEEIDFQEDAILTNARQYANAMHCRDNIASTIQCLKDGLPVDLSCNEAELALQAISEIDGRAVSEDIVSSIFSHFCVGK